MKRIVFVVTTFLMLGVNLTAEVQSTNRFPIEESVNQKIDLVEDIKKVNGMEEISELVELAKKHFGNLSEAEIKFFTAVEKEEVADYSSSNEEENNPENADKWGNDRVLHAEKIKWLCTNRKASEFVTHEGIQVVGVKVEGELDLKFATVDYPIMFFKCRFKETIILVLSKLKLLSLNGSYTGKITADGTKVESGVFLSDGFKTEGVVSFIATEIGGDFDCSGSMFVNPKEKALLFDRSCITGTVYLRNGFKTEGEVCLIDVEILGGLDCKKAEFINPDGKALSADGINVKCSVNLSEGFKAEGEVRFTAAVIDHDFVCTNGMFINPEGYALSADGLHVGGSVFLNNGFEAHGEVRLISAIINKNLSCSKSEFINPKGVALYADAINVKGSVNLRDGFKSEGEVKFLGATIGGDFDCNKGEFSNPQGMALQGDGFNVKGAVFLKDGFKAQGEVRLVSATIDKDLSCNKSEFINPKGDALCLDSANVKGSVYLRDGFKAVGWINLSNANIESFVYTKIQSPEKTMFDLRSAKLGTLWDEKESWPKKGNLYLHGLVYDNLGDDAPKDAKSRIEWLRLNGGKEFSPQPYEQLAEVLKRSGHKKDATKVLIAKNKDLAKLGELNTAQKVWYKVFGPMIGYGYKPLDVFWKGPMGLPFLGSILFWMVLGSIFFLFGYYGESKLMSPSKTGVYAESAEDVSETNATIHNEYPTFQFITYSIDAFVPVVDLHQSKYWLPNANKGKVLCETKWFTIRWGGILLFYLWWHIAVGWILSTLFVVGLTGLVPK